MKTSFVDTVLGGDVQTEEPAAVGGDLRERLRGKEITIQTIILHTITPSTSVSCWSCWHGNLAPLDEDVKSVQ